MSRNGATPKQGTAKTMTSTNFTSVKELRAILTAMGATDRFSVRRIDQRRVPTMHGMPDTVADDQAYEVRMGLHSHVSSACRMRVIIVVGYAQGDGDFRFFSADLSVTGWESDPSATLAKIANA